MIILLAVLANLFPSLGAGATLWDNSIASAAMYRSPPAALYSSIKIDLEVRETETAGQRRVVIDVNYRNVSKSRACLERWLALDPPELTLALLRVTRPDGSFVPYVGVHVNRRSVSERDYLCLRPEESRSVANVDVTSMYAWPQWPEKLRVRVEGFTMANRRLEVIRSSDRELDYHPNRLR
jgi:hypothetical protein